MTRDEKILAKVGKLLAKYGVSEEERKFKNYGLNPTHQADDQDEIEEVSRTQRRGRTKNRRTYVLNNPKPEKVEGEEEVQGRKG